MKTYNASDVTLILEWVEKYFKVAALMNKVFENLPYVPPMENELEYQRLRFWFLKSHDKFVPIWTDFCLANGISIDLNENVKKEYMENPFLYYYPDNLLDLAYMVGTSIADDMGNRDEKDLQNIANINKSFSYTAMHLAHWIGEFADTSDHLPFISE